MNTIDLPDSLNNTLWLEYCDMEYGMSGEFKGFRHYISHKIPNVTVNGTITDGFTLTFDNDEDLTWFVLRWGGHESN